jgi:hypothetical protein
MYYMIVTSTTVGYGDITPKTDIGRFAAMTMISFAIITVPQMSNDLIAKINDQSPYARAHYYPKSSRARHVLVCGDLTSTSLRAFFDELFHEDHATEDFHAVILHPGHPPQELHELMKDPIFYLSITYLEGVPLNDIDLIRAKAATAKAIFMLTNKFSAFPDQEDAKIILQQLSIKRHIRQQICQQKTTKISDLLLSCPLPLPFPSWWLPAMTVINKEMRGHLFCLQLIRPENKRHLVSSKDNNDDNLGTDEGSTRPREVVICLNEIKMGVLAKASIFPVSSNTALIVRS